jgi:phosphoglycerol transferase MdoB-like AlkP superfamily enzyme
VVLECLQGTVLLKRYVEEVVSGDQSFSYALLWDVHSLPTDEGYGTASFLLVFLFMLLDSTMFMLAILLMLSERIAVSAAILWSLAIGAGLLTAQVVFYRSFLWLQICKAMKSDRLKDKCDKLGIDVGDTIQEPALREPVIHALLVGGIITIGLALAASRLAPLGVVLGF